MSDYDPDPQEAYELDVLGMAQEAELDGANFSSYNLADGQERVLMYTDAQGIKRYPQVDKEIQKVLQSSTINQVLLFVLYCDSAGNRLSKTPEGQQLADFLNIDRKKAITYIKEICANLPLITVNMTYISSISVIFLQEFQKFLGYALQHQQDHIIDDWTILDHRYFIAPQHFNYFNEPIRDIEITLTGNISGKAYVVLRPAQYSGYFYDDKGNELDIVIYRAPKIVASFEKQQSSDSWIAKLPGLLWLSYYCSKLLDLTIMIESRKMPTNISVNYTYSQIFLNPLCMHSFTNLCEDLQNHNDCVFTNEIEKKCCLVCERPRN